MSSDLVWLITRNTNSSYLKRGLYTFSTEAGNLSGKHSFKASGFANAKTVNVAAAEEGGVVVSTRSAKLAGSSPKSSVRHITIKKGARAANASVEKILKKYRPDLIPAAKAKVSAILMAQAAAAKEFKPKEKKPRGKKAASA